MTGAVPTRHYDDLLTQILGGAVDPDYQLAAQRRPGHTDGDGDDDGRKARRGGRTALVLVLAVFGVLLGVSALRTEQDRPAEIAERAQLVAQIHSRQSRLEALHSQLTSLQATVVSQQAGLARELTTQSQLTDRLSELGEVTGALGVTGPGITITVDNAGGSSGGLDTVVHDTDLQILANGLWEAGSEAISIGGQRLTSLSSIRFAGRAITVNYRSLTPPYVIQAVGNPDTLAARLLGTDAGAVWVSLEQNYGIRFDIDSAQKVTLPAATHDSLRYARELGGGR